MTRVIAFSKRSGALSRSYRLRAAAQGVCRSGSSRQVEPQEVTVEHSSIIPRGGTRVSAAAETENYLRELRWLFDQMAVVLRDVPPDLMSWRPDTGTANGVATITNHVLAATRVYVLGFGCGRPVERDRTSEFSARATDANALIARLHSTRAEIDEALGTLPEEALSRQFTPPQHLWGTGQPHEITAREAIVESIRHAAIHLGELRLTRDLARAGATGTRRGAV